MATRMLDKNGDWVFGIGKNAYLEKDDEIKQCIITRLKSFKYDYFLDYTANIDWLGLLSIKNNENLIKKEVERVVRETKGVRKIKNIEIITNSKREAIIKVEVESIYNNQLTIEVGIND